VYPLSQYNCDSSCTLHLKTCTQTSEKTQPTNAKPKHKSNLPGAVSILKLFSTNFVTCAENEFHLVDQILKQVESDILSARINFENGKVQFCV